MRLDELVKQVAPPWREEFVRFIESGDAEAGFLEYLDGDERAQEAVERAFSAQAAAFEDLAGALGAEPATSRSQEVAAEARATAVSTNMTLALEEVLALAPDQRETAVQQVASTLREIVDPDKRKELKSVAETLKAALF